MQEFFCTMLNSKGRIKDDGMLIFVHGALDGDSVEV